MSQYFISDASPLKSGAKVDWEFADVGCKKLPVDEIAALHYEGFANRARRTSVRVRC